MNPNNSNYSEERTAEEMEESVGSQPVLVAAAVATGLAIGFAAVKLMEWNDERKSKKTAKN